jgi:hypothetical protein
MMSRVANPPESGAGSILIFLQKPQKRIKIRAGAIPGASSVQGP